ncbi:hypothetical protein V8E53_009978 [Lactarius tabidus]
MADASCPGIISNPDIVGIGTRINFYVTILLAAAIPQNKYTRELLDELYINAVFYGLAILITVLVETIKRQLDLYHAIFVIHMLSCLTVLQFYGFSRFLLAKRIDFKLKMTLLIQICQVLIVLPPWLLYVWIKDSRFGAQPECNHLVKYVFFFVTVRATVNWLRIVFLVGISLGVFYVLISLRSIPSLHKALSAGPEQASDEAPGEALDTEPVPIISLSRILWISSVILAVYGIVTTELIVHRNRPYVQDGENAWGFGQVISVLLLMPIFMEIVAVLKKVRDTRTTGQDEEEAEGKTEGKTEG